jgi:hypothetical protein
MIVNARATRNAARQLLVAERKGHYALARDSAVVEWGFGDIIGSTAPRGCARERDFMAETLLEMAKRHLRESEEALARQRELVARLESSGDEQALAGARAKLHFLEAARDAHRTLLAEQRVRTER